MQHQNIDFCSHWTISVFLIAFICFSFGHGQLCSE
jgi:hypothetical protein